MDKLAQETPEVIFPDQRRHQTGIAVASGIMIFGLGFAGGLAVRSDERPATDGPWIPLSQNRFASDEARLEKPRTMSKEDYIPMEIRK